MTDRIEQLNQDEAFEAWWDSDPRRDLCFPESKGTARSAWHAAIKARPEARAHNDEWNSAIDAAARTSMDMPLTSGEERHDYRWSDTYKTAALEISNAIKALKR